MSSSLVNRFSKLLLIPVLLGCSMALAQSKLTLNQVYVEAKAGRFEQAQLMMQQILSEHPNSAKAYFVQAELFVYQGKARLSRKSLEIAEKISPGLPFAEPLAVGKLRNFVEVDLKIGMADKDVIERWGKPSKINRNTNVRSVNEQWVYMQVGLGYSGPDYLYFENGILKSIHTTELN